MLKRVTGILMTVCLMFTSISFSVYAQNETVNESQVSTLAETPSSSNPESTGTTAGLTGEAVYLIDDNEHPYSGWDFDNRGQGYFSKKYYASYNFTDESSVYPTMLKRDFKEQTTGILTLEGNFSISISDGFVYRITDANDNETFKLYTSGGKYYLLKNDGTGAAVGDITGKKCSLKVVIDVEAQTYDAYLNNTYCGNFSFADACGALCKLYIGFDEAGQGTANIAGVKLYSNYLVNERFLAPFAGIVPADWTVSSTSGTPAVQTLSAPNNTFSTEDIYVLKAENAAGAVTTMSKSFTSFTGNICFETKFIIPAAADGISFSLGNQDNTAFRVVTDSGLLKTGSGETIRSYTQNVWNTLRVEVDTAAQTAFVRFNGKDIGTYALENAVTSFDNIAIKMATAQSAAMSIDDILVFPILPEPADYCPEPRTVDSTGYYVGVHSCNLWRNGFWRGSNAAWDICTAFDELTPYMGYYDEGIPEVADWEIKWMAEHGIDYQLTCWYGPTSITEPVKFPGFSQALHDGFFNAKYKNYSKFAIMWENNFTDSVNSEQFRNNLVPYWLEYYFSDPSYMVIDNKPVFSVYNFDKLVSYFGGVQQAKAEMDYLRQAVKNAGFDDLILLFAGGASPGASRIANMEAVGADGSYAYNWGVSSFTAAFQESAITAACEMFAQSSDKVAHIPTVGVGFNAVARNDLRTPSIPLDEYKRTLNWTKDQLLTNTRYFPDQTLWKSKMVLLSCWNEFDEGHYINPTNLYGFGFIDTLREVFTSNPAHTDAKPTENQVARLQIMAPKDRATLRPLRRYEAQIPANEKTVVKSWSFANQAEAMEWTTQATERSSANSTPATYENGKLIATAIGGDPQIQVADNSLNIPTSSANYVHVRCRVTPESTASIVRGEIFFTTDNSREWTAGKSKAAMIKTGEMIDAYFYVKSNTEWTGNLTSLRFDPMDGKGIYEIELIELLNYAQGSSLTIDGENVEFDQLPTDTQNGRMMFPLNPRTGIFNKLNAYYEWNKTTQTLVIKADSSTFYFTMGSNIAVINGQQVQLYAAPYLVDGIPMIPLDVFCAYTAGYSCVKTGDNSTEIRTPNYEYIKSIHDILNSRVENQWEFNLNWDTENWTAANIASSYVKDGVYYGVTSDNAIDPLLNYSKSLWIDADKYKYIVVRMKHNLTTAASSNAYFYFAPNGSSLSGDKTVKATLQGKSSGDQYIEYVFDMSTNPNWKGMITKLRFDPFATAGEFSIDYIRCIARVDNQWEFEINGDKEGWITSNVASNYVKDGVYYGKTDDSAKDPLLNYTKALSVDANKYKKIIVRMKHNLRTAASSNAYFYFAPSGSSLSEDKTVGAALQGKSSGDQYVDYVFDMSSNPNWKGTITKLRFDPFATAGEFSIDYIKLIPDETAPVTASEISGNAVNGWYTGDVTMTLSSSDDSSGVDKTEFRLGESGDWITYTTPVAITLDGSYIVQYRSTDKAGNVEGIKQAIVKLDTTAPLTTAAAIGIVRSDGTYNSHVSVTLAAEDTAGSSGVAGIEYSLDGANWMAYTAPLELNDNGTYSISYKATDNAGNVETVKNVNIMVSMDPAVMVSYLKEKVNAISMEDGIKNSLISKLDNVLSSIADGNKNSPANKLNAFINEVDAQNGKKLTVEQADELKAEANKIIAGINNAGMTTSETITVKVSK